MNTKEIYESYNVYLLFSVTRVTRSILRCQTNEICIQKPTNLRRECAVTFTLCTKLKI